jgi:hypothetical protein
VQKWEYCIITGIVPWSGGIDSEDHLQYFGEGSPEITYFRHTRDARRPQILAQTIAQLGEEGWEMVGCAFAGVRGHHLYFKRPKPASSG